MPATPEKRALVTGGSGFAGSHLLALLLDEGWESFSFDLSEPIGPALGRAGFLQGDVLSKEKIVDALLRVRPDVVYHLAGIAFVPDAEKDRPRALSINVLGGVNILEAVKEAAPAAKVLVISSSEVYGKNPPEKMPLGEKMPVKPANFYAFTKVALEHAADYGKGLGLDVTVLRPFNHIGPRQSDLFVASAFARQVAQAERGEIPPVIKVGNLEAVRDFTDVEDMARAYFMAGTCELDSPGPFNLSSGKGIKIQEILDTLLDLARIRIKVEHDPERLRLSDMPVLVGDNSLFSRETGWIPRVPLAESLKRILDYWRDVSSSPYL